MNMKKINLWEYCQLRAPEFYTDVRVEIRLFVDTLQSLYERKAEQRKAVINMPHRSGKTRTLRLFAEWVFKQDVNNHVIAASYNADVAQDFKRHMQEGIGADLPSTFKSVGIGDSLTGWSADVSILDDPIKDAYEANNLKILDRQWKWFTNTLSARLDQNAIQIVCMTRWCDDDIVGRITGGANVREWLVLNLGRS